MTKEELVNRITELLSDPWTESEEEIENDRNILAYDLDNGEVSFYIKILEEHRDYECKPIDGIHGEYDLDRMREFDEVIEELKGMEGEKK